LAPKQGTMTERVEQAIRTELAEGKVLGQWGRAVWTDRPRASAPRPLGKGVGGIDYVGEQAGVQLHLLHLQ
jgi:hypothetical protein